jgi:hypothetical protein
MVKWRAEVAVNRIILQCELEEIVWRMQKFETGDERGIQLTFKGTACKKTRAARKIIKHNS